MRQVLPFCAILLAGCVGQKGLPGHAGEPYLVKTRETQFYQYGPAQVNGPDLALAKGRQVTMLKYEFGYSQVALENGESGYVSTDDLMPGPAAASPAPGISTQAAPAGRHARAAAEPHSRPPTREEESEVPPPPLPEH